MQDRVPLYPGRVTLTPVSGQANTYDLTRADQPTQEGTPLNKASLLKDATAALFGKTNAAVPDDILSLLSKSALAERSNKYTKKTLNQFATGDIVPIKENGVSVDFYVAKHDYESGLNGTGKTLLVRKDFYLASAAAESVNAYANSTIDKIMTSYLSLIGDSVRSAIKPIKIPYTPGNGTTSVSAIEREAFILSLTELDISNANANAEGTPLPIASALKNTSAETLAGGVQWTRTPALNSQSSFFMVNKLGSAYSQAVGNKLGVRPAFALPSKFAFYVDSSGNLCTIDEVETQITDVLGNLIAIPVDQIKDGVKIATGSYTGTGTYGASNPNSLTFDFEPKWVLVYNKRYATIPFASNIGAVSDGFMWTPDVTSLKIFDSGTNYGNTTFSLLNNILSWSSDRSAKTQINESNQVYKYVAFG